MFDTFARSFVSNSDYLKKKKKPDSSSQTGGKVPAVPAAAPDAKDAAYPSAPAGRPPPRAGNDDSCDWAKYRANALKEHNRLRSLHGVPPLTIDEQVNI
jgi:uncharacterized protein YkwD